jgi:hypothetical protein
MDESTAVDFTAPVRVFHARFCLDFRVKLTILLTKTCHKRPARSRNNSTLEEFPVSDEHYFYINKHQKENHAD